MENLYSESSKRGRPANIHASLNNGMSIQSMRIRSPPPLQKCDSEIRHTNRHTDVAAINPPTRHTTWSPSNHTRSTSPRAPQLPPKQVPFRHTSLNKTTSWDSPLNNQNQSAINYPIEDTGIYICPDEIQSFPSGGAYSARQSKSPLQDEMPKQSTKAPPPAPGIRVRKPRQPREKLQTSQHSTTNVPPLLSTNKKRNLKTSSNLYHRSVESINITNHIQFPSLPSDSDDSDRCHSLELESRTKQSMPEQAIYGMTRGEGLNLVMELDSVKSKLFKLYTKIGESHSNSPTLSELKTYLRLPDHETATSTMKQVYEFLAPPLETKPPAKSPAEIYVVNFCEFKDKFDLRKQIINMFAKPGPPSISYARVDAKMDGIITEFAARTEELYTNQTKCIESPAHARYLMQGFTDAEGLVKVLRENELWIKWGTATNLPHLSHLYMHKQPPTYEVRKAVTISSIAERERASPNIPKMILNSHSLCPPIYSRLKHDNSNVPQWQVTEYNETSGKFETRECQFPSWLDEEKMAISMLNSTNRAFAKGTHPYELYAVYVVIIKDFTLVNDLSAYSCEKDWAMPKKYQYFVGSSSTGVLYRFTRTEDNHCDRIWKVLTEAPKLNNFRCYDECDLVEACLALSWIKNHPHAVFVLNSFLPAEKSSLSLDRKKPYKDKMLNMQRHLIEGKKNLSNMCYGMNRIWTGIDDME